MADVKISELTALTSPDGAEELVVNDGGTTKKITITNATSAKAPIASPVFTGTVNAPTVSASVRLDTDLIKSKSNTPLSFQLSDGTAVGSFSNTTGALVSNFGLDSSQKIVSGKTAGQYGSVAEFKAEGSGVKLRIDDNSNASATTRMHIMHNYNRDSGNETCDSSSVGQAAIKFDNGSITFATAAAGNTTAPTNRMSIDNAGIVTKPYQPAFSAYAAAAQNNLSTAYNTITFDTERFDQNADFNTSTHTFTAPVTGKYLFAACVGLKAIPLNCQWIFMRIITSNAGYNMSEETAKWDADTSNGFTTGFASSVLADMDAGDTASVDIYQYTGTSATDVQTGQGYTWFTGHLVC
jgi:hypothetical protein